MVMGEPDRIQAIDLSPEELQPQFGRGVDQEAPLAALEERRVTGSPISRIERSAGRAPAPDDGNSEGRASSEKVKLHLSRKSEDALPPI
jgi:hypothetical protein